MISIHRFSCGRMLCIAFHELVFASLFRCESWLLPKKTLIGMIARFLAPGLVKIMSIILEFRLEMTEIRNFTLSLFLLHLHAT